MDVPSGVVVRVGRAAHARVIGDDVTIACREPIGIDEARSAGLGAGAVASRREDVVVGDDVARAKVDATAGGDVVVVELDAVAAGWPPPFTSPLSEMPPDAKKVLLRSTMLFGSLPPHSRSM